MMPRKWASSALAVSLLIGAVWDFVGWAQDCPTPPEFAGETRAFVEIATQTFLFGVDSGMGLVQGGPGTNLESMLSAAQSMNALAREVGLVSVAFRRDTFKDEAGIAAPLRAGRFWCILAPSDTVLLSDSVTHHYTGVFEVDRQAGTITFADVWPDKFFLLPDKNEEDVEAQIIKHDSGKRLVRITREELRRVIVGIVTYYRPNLIDYYTRLQPEAADDLDAYLPIVTSLLKVPIKANLKEAVTVLTRFIENPTQKDNESFPKAARRLEEIYLLLAFGAPGNTTIMPQTEYIERARALRHRFGAQTVLADLDFDELKFFFRGATKAEAFADAEEFIDILINRFPSVLGMRVSRADLRYRNGTYQGVVDDASVAIKRHAEALGAIYQLDIQPSERQRREVRLSHRLALSLYLRAKANLKLGDLDNVLLDAQQLARFRMPLSNIFFAMVYMQEGSFDGARNSLRPDDPLASKSPWVAEAWELLERPDTAVPIEKVVELLTTYIELERPVEPMEIEQLETVREKPAIAMQPQVGHLYEIDTYKDGQRQIGRIFVYKNSKAINEFQKIILAGGRPESTEHLWSCIVWSGSPAIANGKDKEGNIYVTVDVRKAKGGMWSPSLPEKERGHFCRGVVLDYQFKAQSE